MLAARCFMRLSVVIFLHQACTHACACVFCICDPRFLSSESKVAVGASQTKQRSTPHLLVGSCCSLLSLSSSMTFNCAEQQFSRDATVTACSRGVFQEKARRSSNSLSLSCCSLSRRSHLLSQSGVAHSDCIIPSAFSSNWLSRCVCRRSMVNKHTLRV